MSLEQVRNPDS